MQLPIYIFSAKQGMQWLSGTSADVVHLETIRKRIGKLADFDAGEAPYRGILADNEKCYVYTCFLAPRFDFRGRDATYFIFTEIPNVYWNTFDFDALLHSELFTKPCMQINDSMTFDGDRFVKPFALNTTQQDFIGANYWLKRIPANTEIRFHQEGEHSAPITYSEKSIISPRQNASPQVYVSDLQQPANKHTLEIEVLKQKIEALQRHEYQLQHSHQASQNVLEQKLRQLQLENHTLKQTIKNLKQKNRSLTHTVDTLSRKNRLLYFGLIAIATIILLLTLVSLAYRYTSQRTQAETLDALETQLEELCK